MNHIQGKAVQMDRDGGEGGSYDQGVFGRRPKHDFPKYPGNNPDWIEPKRQAEFKPRGRTGADGESEN